MSIIENSGLILSLSVISVFHARIETAFLDRVVWLWKLGWIFFVLSLLGIGLILLWAKLQLQSPTWIRKALFWLFLVGILCVILSITIPGGYGIGHHTEDEISFHNQEQINADDLTSFTLGQPNIATLENTQASLCERKTIYVRVYGNKIYFSNYPCENMTVFMELIEAIPNTAEVYLIDDYAQDTIYEKVENAFVERSIPYGQFESKK